MNDRYRDLMAHIQVPKDLDARVLQAARQKNAGAQTDRPAPRRWQPALRLAVCAACALALVAGTVRLSPPAPTLPGEVRPAFSFGLTAYAADTGETILPNANGGLALLSGDGQLDPKWGGFTGTLFQVTGEDIQRISLSVSKGGLYRSRMHTDLTAQQRDAFRKAMGTGKLVPAAISQDESGNWSMPELTVLGSTVTEDYDPAVQYGFWIAPEDLFPESSDMQDRFYAHVDLFDGAVLTVTVTLSDGTSHTKEYQLSTGRLKFIWEENGSSRLLPQLAGENESYLYGIYTSDGSVSRFFHWPVQGSRTVSLSAPYGTVNGADHPGIDIPAPAGESILAAADGTVTKTGFNAAIGNYLLLDHGGGLTTVYGCCRELAVEEGDRVRAGEALGAIGSTGRSTGPHLHFEVRQDDAPQDPVAYFDSAVRDTLHAE